MDLYEIIITPDAEKDLVELRNYITDVLLARDTARSYVRAIRKEIAALNKMPTRYKPVDDEPWHSKGVRRIYLISIRIPSQQKTTVLSSDGPFLTSHAYQVIKL